MIIRKYCEVKSLWYIKVCPKTLSEKALNGMEVEVCSSFSVIYLTSSETLLPSFWLPFDACYFERLFKNLL